jgi:hypothetical protein
MRDFTKFPHFSLTIRSKFNKPLYNQYMLASKTFLRWVLLHLLAFLFIPLCIALAGLLTAALLSVEPYVFVPYLLAPFIAGVLLGALVSWLQVVAMRNAGVNIRSTRWVLTGMLGMALAAMAYAWAYSSPVFLYPQVMAALFSACVYGLACALPQSRLLGEQAEASWRWLLFSLLAALLAFPLVYASVWLLEGPAYFWLIFSFAAAGGVLFGLLTGIESRTWSGNS